jgi:hypothetical protein
MKNQVKCRYWSYSEEDILEQEKKKGTPVQEISQKLNRPLKSIISKIARGRRKHPTKNAKNWTRTNPARPKKKVKVATAPLKKTKTKSIVEIFESSVLVYDFKGVILDGNKVTILLKNESN